MLKTLVLSSTIRAKILTTRVNRISRLIWFLGTFFKNWRIKIQPRPNDDQIIRGIIRTSKSNFIEEVPMRFMRPRVFTPFEKSNKLKISFPAKIDKIDFIK